MSEPVTLEFLARQMARLLNEVGTLRDDMLVQTAIITRMDGTLSGAVGEIRAMHSQYSRLAARVRALEEPAE